MSESEPSFTFRASADGLLEELTRRVLESVRAELEKQDDWLDSRRAADYLSMSLGRLHNLTSAGRIPFHREGGRLVFRRSELDKWIESGRAAA